MTPYDSPKNRAIIGFLGYNKGNEIERRSGVGTPSAMTQEGLVPMCSQSTPTPTEETTEYALIPLHGRNGVGQFATVDKDVLDLVNEYRWYITGAERYVGEKLLPRTVRYAIARIVLPNGKNKSLFMHRLILGANPGQTVDHIDRNGLNNVRSNLRFATRSQNCANRMLLKSNASGFKGVSWGSRGFWRASVCCTGKQIFLGTYKNKVDAARAYDAAVVDLFGEFAVTNESLGLYGEGDE